MIVLSPEGKARTSVAKVAAVPRFQDLHGKVVGLLDNSKPNADKLAERFADLLKKEYGVAKVISRRKLTAQQGAPKEYLDELAAQADFVLSGLGD
jgi:DNA-binding ferritin-like protein